MKVREEKSGMIGKGACLLKWLLFIYIHGIDGHTKQNDIYLNVHFFPSFAFAYHSLRRLCVCVVRYLVGVVIFCCHLKHISSFQSFCCCAFAKRNDLQIFFFFFSLLFTWCARISFFYFYIFSWSFFFAFAMATGKTQNIV